MQEGKDDRAVDIVIQIIGAYIDRAKRFQNEANITGLHSIYFDMMYKVLSRNYGRRWFVAKLESLRKDVCVFKQKVANKFSSLCTSGLVPQKLLLLGHLIENMSRCGSLPALNTSPYKRKITSIKKKNCYTVKWHATRIEEMLFGLV